MVLFSRPAEVYRITPQGPGEHVAGDIWAVPAFLIAAPEPVFAFGKRPGVHLREEPTRRRCGARGACGGPAAPSPHRRPGAGRGADGAARRRGGSAAGTARSSWRAGGDRGSVARCLSGPVWIQLASGCAFSAHFLLLSGRGNELLLGKGGSGCGHRDPAARLLFPERAVTRRTPGRVGDRRSSRGAALGGVSGRARGGGQGQGRRTDVGGGGRMEERRSRVTQPQRGPAPPRHHGPG